MVTHGYGEPEDERWVDEVVLMKEEVNEDKKKMFIAKRKEGKQEGRKKGVNE